MTRLIPPIQSFFAPIITALLILVVNASLPTLVGQEPAAEGNPFADEATAEEAAVENAPAENPATGNPAAENSAEKKKAAEPSLPEKKTEGPFAAPVAPLQKKEDSPALSFKNAKGAEVPVIDDRGRVVFQRPEDKKPSEMTEKDFYQTITPAERAILAENPTSAPDLLAAAVMISRVGRPEFALLLTEKSLAAEGTPEAFSAMIDRIGPDRLAAFRHNDQIGEPAAQAADRAWDEARKYWSDPAVIRTAFDQTMKGSLDDKANAILALRKGGPDAIALLLEKLAGEEASSADQARTILSRLGVYATGALFSAMESNDEKTLTAVAGTLAQTEGLTDISPLLVRFYDPSLSSETHAAIENAILAQAGSVPTAADAAATLSAQGLGYFEGRTPLADSIDGQTNLWIYNAETQRPEPVILPDAEARRHLAAKYLLAAHQLDPENEALLLSAAVAEAERMLCANGLDQPIDPAAFQKIFPNLSVATLEKMLTYAQQSGHPKGGILPAMLLGASGDASAVLGKGEPTPLVRAASSGDRRLRFAALQAIGRINPSAPFPGSSSVTSALVHFAASRGKRFAVVAIPKLAETAAIGNFLTEGGVGILPATTGGDILRLAQENPDVEFIVAVSYLDRPDLRTVAQTLAADYRTGDIPMLIALEDETRVDQAQWYGFGERNTLVSVLPFDAESGRTVREELFHAVLPEQVPAETRLAQARTAIALLGTLLVNGKNGCSLDDLEPFCAQLLRTPRLADEARAFALNVKSTAVQNILGDLVGDTRYDLEERKKSLDTFKAHIEKYGLLLRGPDIKRLYARYNASETEDRATQQLLSDLLDILEANRAKP